MARRLSRRAGAPWARIFGIGAGVTTTRGRGTFVDSTVPVGTTIVSYLITPMRPDQVGTPSDVVTVQFGVGGGASVTGARLQMAA